MSTEIKIKNWIQAFRLRTLPLALSTVGMGAFLAAFRGKFNEPVFIWSIITTLLLQILSNLANDYGDFISGIDGSERKGPSRSVQSGAISESSMKFAIIIFSILSLLSGLYLLYISVGFGSQAFMVFLGLGILSIVAAITYTVGKKPYGYAGLGDLSVFVFFGFTGVLGAYYLHAKTIELTDFLPAIFVGAFSVAVLNVNNIRDIESDKKSGKYSVPVRIGRRKAVIYHNLLLITGFISAIAFVVTNYHSPVQFLFMLTLPLFIKNALGVSRNSEPEALDPYLKQMAISTLIFVILFGLGMILS